jgi:hypothetical protein
MVRTVAVISFGCGGRLARGRSWAYDRSMLGPSRPVPRVGARARIAHFGGGFELGTVIAVHDEGRRLDVRDEGGEVLEFVLSPATARFVCAGIAHGPRLELLGEQT